MVSALVTGTLFDKNERDIRKGGNTIGIALADAEWDPTVGEDNPITQAIIDGLVSDQSEPNGWNAVVKPGLTFNDVVRTSDIIVTITLPAFPTYDIAVEETVTVTVPDSAFTPTGVAVVSGTLIIDDEKAVRAGGSTIIITLSEGVTWQPTVGQDNPLTQAIIDGITSDKDEPNGWNALVKPGLTFNDVERTSDTVVTITLPGFPGYDITENETLTLVVPDSAIVAAPVASAHAIITSLEMKEAVALNPSIGTTLELI